MLFLEDDMKRITKIGKERKENQMEICKFSSAFWKILEDLNLSIQDMGKQDEFEI